MPELFYFIFAFSSTVLLYFQFDFFIFC